MRFTKLNTPIKLDESELEALAQLYPYSMFNYTELREEACTFLNERIPCKPQSHIVGITNHNGRGRQWGVLCMREAVNVPWQLIVHCGHRPFGFWWQMKIVKWVSRYLRRKRRSPFESPLEYRTLVQM